MKIIPLHKNYAQLISKARKNDRHAQRQLYETFAPKMLAVCRNYIRCRDMAEEVMLNGFFKMFTHLNDFENQGSFEGWIRRIMVNECISHLRKSSKMNFVSDERLENTSDYATEIDTELEAEEIQNLIDELPDGYKTVFVLYVMEGYKHKEISEMLEITESTSKSQLFKARKMLQEKIKNANKISYESV